MHLYSRKILLLVILFVSLSCKNSNFCGVFHDLNEYQKAPNKSELAGYYNFLDSYSNLRNNNLKELYKDSKIKIDSNKISFIQFPNNKNDKIINSWELKDKNEIYSINLKNRFDDDIPNNIKIYKRKNTPILFITQIKNSNCITLRFIKSKYQQ